jgi:hypothetical protein
MFPVSLSLSCFFRRFSRTLARSLTHLIYLHNAYDALMWFLGLLNG